MHAISSHGMLGASNRGRPRPKTQGKQGCFQPCRWCPECLQAVRHLRPTSSGTLGVSGLGYLRWVGLSGTRDAGSPNLGYLWVELRVTKIGDYRGAWSVPARVRPISSARSWMTGAIRKEVAVSRRLATSSCEPSCRARAQWIASQGEDVNAQLTCRQSREWGQNGWFPAISSSTASSLMGATSRRRSVRRAEEARGSCLGAVGPPHQVDPQKNQGWSEDPAQKTMREHRKG